MSRFIVFICLVALFAGSFTGYAYAQKDTVEPGTVVFTGRIKYFSYGGGFYGISTLGGKEYRPTRLDSSFQVEGLRVRVVARPVEGKLFMSGWGTPIEILKIERIGRE